MENTTIVLILVRGSGDSGVIEFTRLLASATPSSNGELRYHQRRIIACPICFSLSLTRAGRVLRIARQAKAYRTPSAQEDSLESHDKLKHIEHRVQRNSEDDSLLFPRKLTDKTIAGAGNNQCEVVGVSEQKQTDLSEMIADEFGPNASYVEGLLNRFRSNPDLVDDSWRSYFSELLGDGTISPQSSGNGRTAAVVATDVDVRSVKTEQGKAATGAATERKTATVATSGETDVEIIPIRGAALKIVKNMETSLSVPTATSQRRIPVKLLDENRRIINKYLSENDRGKASYTHLIAWAILRALEEFPQLNDGYGEVEGTPSRMKRQHVNLGVAIDLLKKDATRTLLVPNIKNAERLRFSEFLAAYDDIVNRRVHSAPDGRTVSDYRDRRDRISG